MNYALLPQPEVVELHGEFAWFLWDRAVEEQDTGFFKLQPVDQKPVNLSERSAFRREVRS